MRVSDAPADDETRRVLHRTIAAVRDDMATMGFNTAIARLIECNNHLTHGGRPRRCRAARGRGAARADGRAARAAHRRGAVGAARPPRHAHLRGVPDRRSRVARRGDGRGPGAGQRQGARPRERRRPAPTKPSTSASPAPTRRSPSCSRARRSARSIVVPGRLVNFVVAGSGADASQTHTSCGSETHRAFPGQCRRGGVGSAFFLGLPVALPPRVPRCSRARRRSCPIHSTFRARSRRGRPTSPIACARCAATRASARPCSRASRSRPASRGSARASRRPRPRRAPAASSGRRARPARRFASRTTTLASVTTSTTLGRDRRRRRRRGAGAGCREPARERARDRRDPRRRRRDGRRRPRAAQPRGEARPTARGSRCRSSASRRPPSIPAR